MDSNWLTEIRFIGCCHSGAAPIAAETRADLPHGQLGQNLSPEQPRPALIEQPASFGAQKRPGIEKRFLFVVVDGDHAFPA